MFRRISIIAALAASLMVFPALASAHVVQSISIDCNNVSGFFKAFPAGPNVLTIASLDTVQGVVVPTSVTATVQGPQGSFVVPAPAPAGSTHRDVTISWPADGGGSTTASADVACPPAPPHVDLPQAPPTVYVNVPGPTVYVNVPGPTVTVYKTKIVKVRVIKRLHDRASFTCAAGDKKTVVYKKSIHHWFGVCYHTVIVPKKVTG